jgi:hypothetical protein
LPDPEKINVKRVPQMPTETIEEQSRTWTTNDPPATRVARNVIARSLFIGTEIAVGLLLLPFNLTHPGG